MGAAVGGAHDRAVGADGNYYLIVNRIDIEEILFGAGNLPGPGVAAIRALHDDPVFTDDPPNLSTRAEANRVEVAILKQVRTFALFNKALRPSLALIGGSQQQGLGADDINRVIRTDGDTKQAQPRRGPGASYALDRSARCDPARQHHQQAGAGNCPGLKIVAKHQSPTTSLIRACLIRACRATRLQCAAALL